MTTGIYMLKLKIPPPVYALFIAALMWLLNSEAPLFHWTDAPWNKAGFGLMAVGIGIDLWAVGAILASQNNHKPT